MVILILVGVGASLAIWVPASNGSKEAALGSSLFSGVVVGVAVLLVGQIYQSVQDRNRNAEALRRTDAIVPPAEDELPESDRQGVTVTPGTATVTVTTEPPRTVVEQPRSPRRFTVVYEGSQPDTSRLDAVQIRLRLFEAVDDAGRDAYTQFVTIPVPRPELRNLVGSDPNVTQGRLWWHIAHSIEPQLQDAIRRGEIPTATPSFAYEIETYDLMEAVRQARLDSDPQQEVKAGEVIYRFVTPSYSSREGELAAQIHQIIGYDASGDLLVIAPRRYRMQVVKMPSDGQLSKLRELAAYQDVSITLDFEGTEIPIGRR